MGGRSRALLKWNWMRGKKRSCGKEKEKYSFLTSNTSLNRLNSRIKEIEAIFRKRIEQKFLIRVSKPTRAESSMV